MTLSVGSYITKAVFYTVHKQGVKKGTFTDLDGASKLASSMKGAYVIRETHDLITKVVKRS
jgi:hypothetical protein